MPWSFTSASGGMTLPFRRKRYTINEPEPTYQVIYLGNVLTIMAKGEGCVEKPLALIWKTHISRTRPDLQMKLIVTKSGLKAETKLQGLTEYWAHRVTYCVAPPGYPKVFCWIYKHEGKKMKPELRCHAVLCKKESDPASLAVKLHDTLQSALREYKREKVARQNTRLSGSLTARRKAMLSTGTSNFRPPMSRSKSAPKLGMIEEGMEEEEEGEEDEEMEEDEDGSESPGPGTPMNGNRFRMPSVSTSDDRTPSPSSINNNNDEKRLPAHLFANEEEDNLSDEGSAVVEHSMIPGTPSELEFANDSPDYSPLSSFRRRHDSLQRCNSSPNSPRLVRPHLVNIDFELGNDVEKLRLEADFGGSRRSSNADTEPDSISDESGYHEEKSSLEDADRESSNEEEPEFQVTSL